MLPAASTTRAMRLSLAVGFLMLVLKVGAYVLTGSASILGDAAESVVHVAAVMFAAFSLGLLKKPADDDHPYGHGKAEPLASAMVATLLLLAAVWIAAHSVREIFRPHAAPAPWTLAVLVLVVLVKETLFRFVLREGVSVESSAVQGDAWHHRSDAITSLFAGIGIAFALVGGPDYAAADDVAALLASGVIAWNGWRLLRGAFGELMDTAPDFALVAEIRGLAAGVPQVRGIEKCFIRKMGWHLYVDMHVEVDPQMSVEQAHRVAHTVKDTIRVRLPKVRDVLVHIEPTRSA